MRADYNPTIHSGEISILKTVYLREFVFMKEGREMHPWGSSECHLWESSPLLPTILPSFQSGKVFCLTY